MLHKTVICHHLSPEHHPHSIPHADLSDSPPQSNSLHICRSFEQIYDCHERKEHQIQLFPYPSTSSSQHSTVMSVSHTHMLANYSSFISRNLLQCHNYNSLCCYLYLSKLLGFILMLVEHLNFPLEFNCVCVSHSLTQFHLLSPIICTVYH